MDDFYYILCTRLRMIACDDACDIGLSDNRL